MEICWKSTSNLLDTSMVWKFVESQLPTFWTLPWYGNLLKVNFQPFGHFHGMEICWKTTSNLLDTSMVWQFVGRQLPTFWTLPWYGNLLEDNFQHFGHFHGMAICWKSTSNLLDISMVWQFVGSQLPTFWTLPWDGNLLEVGAYSLCTVLLVCRFTLASQSSRFPLLYYITRTGQYMTQLGYYVFKSKFFQKKILTPN